MTSCVPAASPLVHAAALSAFLLTAASGLPAQYTTASIVGTVTDTNGEPLPNARVILTHLGVGITRETRSDPDGNFSVSFLQVGEYRVEVRMEGYPIQVVPELRLHVGQIQRLNFVLQAGENSSPDPIEIDIRLQTESAAVRTLVDRQSIILMPLDGRNFIQLAQFLPGVFPGTPGSVAVTRGRGSIGESSPETGVTAISTNGARDTANRFFLDGVEFLDFDSTIYPFSPSIESISEMKVETSTYSALYGAAPGAHVDLITLAGGQQYHGTLWLFNRNDYFTQTRDAIGRAPVDSPRLNRNQFGLNAGGPLTPPRRLAPESRSFFFFNWESGRLRENSLGEFRKIPPEAMRRGDFRSLMNARTGEPIALRDPLGAGIVNNLIPAAALSPQALAFLRFVPAPNTPDPVLNFRSSEQRAFSSQDNYLGRIDHVRSSNDTVTLRYIFNKTIEGGMPFWGNDQRDNRARAHNLLAEYVRTFSPAQINKTRLGWNRISEFESFGTTGRPEFDIAGLMGVPLASRRAQDFGPPAIRINGPDGEFSVFNLPSDSGPRDRANSAWQFSSIHSWRRGPHSVQFGADVIRKSVAERLATNPRGRFEFDGSFTGSALADFMLGYVRTAAMRPTPVRADLRSTWQSFFIQDDWRVNPQLTVNFGWRWDRIPPFRQANGQMINIEQRGFQVTGVVTPETSRFGRTLIQGNPTNFGPRFGLAYTPEWTRDTVIRTGWGLYFAPGHPNAALRMTEAAQERSAAFVQADPSMPPSVLFGDPFSGPLVTQGVFVSVDQHLRDSYVQHWNFTIQRKLAGIMVDAGYVGSKSTRLHVTFDDLNRPVEAVDPTLAGLPPLNERRPNPAFPGPVPGEKSVGNAIYHALQVKAQRESATGLTLLAAYTWSKCLSGPGDSGGFISGGSFVGSPQDIYNLRADRSLCGFDIAHRLAGSLVYSIPGFRYYPRPMRPLLEGWRLGAIPTISSGLPAPVDFGFDTTGTGVASRPDQAPGVKAKLPRSERSYQRWFNVAAFTPPPNGRFGNSPRTGAIRLPGTVNLDISLTKSFQLREPARLDFRVEVFNVFNTFNPPPGSVDRNLLSANFGTVGGGVLGIATRIVQFAAKIHLR